MSYRAIKVRTYEILEKGQLEDKWSKRIDLFIIYLILLNVLAVIIESVASLRTNYEDFFSWFERFSIVIFTLEYVLRIWSITENPKYASSVKGRLKYMLSFYSIIDLLAIVPAYIPLLITVDTRVLRAVRIFRLLRILKLSRYNRAFSHIRTVVVASKDQLLISLSAVFGLLVVASCLMYFVENEAQPDKFSSIPATMWWGVATLTTVGYGDVYPITGLGKVIGGVMAVLGVGLFALPAGILASGFGQAIEIKEEKEEDTEETHEHDNNDTCSHCGQKIHS